jgi:transcription elongation GreA/GreB family factor
MALLALFASSYYRDTNGVFNDLVEMLGRMGIEPTVKTDKSQGTHRFTEHRTAERSTLSAAEANAEETLDESERTQRSGGIQPGDKIVLYFADTGKRLSARLFDDGEDLEKGRHSIHSELGKAICGSEEGDEREFSADGRIRKVLIESVERNLTLETPSNDDVPSAVDSSPVAGLWADNFSGPQLTGTLPDLNSEPGRPAA